jgi:desulfoferrodoxin (superoxide reductase-like protein)
VAKELVLAHMNLKGIARIIKESFKEKCMTIVREKGIEKWQVSSCEVIHIMESNHHVEG